VLDASSLGRVAPKTKSINVEANLLSERIAEHERVREGTAKSLIALLSVILLSAIVLPPLFRFEAAASQKAAAADLRLQNLDREVQDLQKQQDSAKPAIADKKLSIDVRKNADVYLGQLMQFLNLTTPDMAVADLKTQIDSGRMLITVRAEAENYAAAREFVAKASKGAEQDTALISTSRSATLSPEGVAFDLVKKITVDQ
jgi:type II secretory pathway pseudopilin PulG